MNSNYPNSNYPIRDDRYSRPAVLLHWTIALGIILNLAYGLNFATLEAAKAPNLRAIIDLHKSIGIAVIGLVLLRIFWRIRHRPPAPLPALRPWERWLSNLVHHLLYLLMFVVPLAGWLHDSAWTGAASHPLMLFHTVPFFRLPFFHGMDERRMDYWHALLGTIHAVSAKLLMGVIGLHILGAIKHQFFDRQQELQRMWFER
jgi:cytochrome b561